MSVERACQRVRSPAPVDRRLQEQLERSLAKLHDWIVRNGWAGYDPYDVEHWYLQLPSVVRRTRPLRRLGRLPVRMASRYPSLLRRLLRIEKRIYPKAMGLFTESYVRMYEHSGRDEYLRLAEECAHWLLDNVSEGYAGFGWGLPIDWQSRILIPAGTPCGIVSVICGEGFWRLYRCTGQTEYLDYCIEICRGFVEDLNIDAVYDDAICFSFTPLDHFHVHNPNLWIASFLIKIGQQINSQEYINLGLKAARYALLEQREDGAITYWGADQDETGALDHYHCGFKIRALLSLWKLTERQEFHTAAAEFYQFYRRTFIDQQGRPLRNPHDPSIVDVHGCAEALICNAQLLPDFPEARATLRRSLLWTIKHMQTPAGYFIYRIVQEAGRQRCLDVPYMRWGQAWMLQGLVRALAAFDA